MLDWHCTMFYEFHTTYTECLKTSGKVIFYNLCPTIVLATVDVYFDCHRLFCLFLIQRFAV